MTLVAGFRCGSAAVVCADSVEAAGDYRVTVNKIVPHECGEFQVAYAGSGLASLVDNLCARVFLAIKASKVTTVSAVETKIQRALNDFYKSAAIKHYPAETEQKTVSALICLRSATTGEVGLFRIQGTVLAQVQEFSLVGWEETLYKLAAKRMFRADLSITQGILAGLQVIGLAKETSQYVGGATSVLVASERGMWLEPPGTVQAAEETIASVTKHLDRLLVSAPDTAISYEEFDQELSRIKAELLQIRDRAFQDAARRAVEAAQRTPLMPIPVGSTVFLSNEKVNYAQQPVLLKHMLMTVYGEVVRKAIEFHGRMEARVVGGRSVPVAITNAVRRMIETVEVIVQTLRDSAGFPDIAEQSQAFIESFFALRGAANDTSMSADFGELFPSQIKGPAEAVNDIETPRAS